MTQEDFNKLQRGDLIKHKTSPTAYMVAGNYGNRVTAVATADICNPDEWSVVYKVEPKRAKTPKEVMIELNASRGFPLNSGKRPMKYSSN